MKYEGVTFVEEQVRKMSKDSFVVAHFPYLWQDRKERERKKMLSTVYDLICKPSKTGDKE